MLYGKIVHDLIILLYLLGAKVPYLKQCFIDPKGRILFRGWSRFGCITASLRQIYVAGG